MQFVVIGVDGPSFGIGADLAEAHWSYLDGFADVLVARGPTLSADGEEHTGSVHVLDLADRAAAERFAGAEPFACAGWYSAVTIDPVLACIAGTMWQRPPAGPVSAFVTVDVVGDQPAKPLAARVRRRLRGSVPWVYVGVRADDEGRATGLVAAVDLAPDVALPVVREVLGGAAGAGTAQRWERGGRR